MPSLFVIGNGFDRFFNLNTSYEDDFKPLVEEHLGESTFNTLNLLFYWKEPGDLWSDFERIIGCTNPQAQAVINDNVYSALDSYSETTNESGLFLDEDRDYDAQLFDQAHAIDNALPSYDQVFSVLNEATLDEIYNALDFSMREMVEKANEQLIQIKPKGCFPEDSYFITFNYTDTLERLYNIQDERTLHVHGRYAIDDEVIWGNEEQCVSNNRVHFYLDIDDLANRPDISEHENDFTAFPGYQEQLQVIDDHQFQISEYANTAASTLNDFCHNMIKHLNMEDMINFLHTLPSNVTDIYVLGHSLADVDTPYIRAIADAFPQAAWTVSYHEEKQRPEQRLECINHLVPGKRTSVKTIEDILGCQQSAHRIFPECPVPLGQAAKT